MAAICQSPMLLDSLFERIQLRGGGRIDVLMILAFQLALVSMSQLNTKRHTPWDSMGKGMEAQYISWDSDQTKVRRRRLTCKNVTEAPHSKAKVLRRQDIKGA